MEQVTYSNKQIQAVVKMLDQLTISGLKNIEIVGRILNVLDNPIPIENKDETDK